jgi:serine/threonine protein kinase
MPFPWQEGTIFAKRYRVVRPIAFGGMAAVYEVIHVETGRARALKVILPHIFASPPHRERFQREACIASRVESKYVVDIVDAGVDGETSMPFLVMELLPGEDLGQRLKRTGALPPGEALVYLHQIALALAKTQKAGIIHRDLKPANLFLVERDDEAPHVKILDFGIAKILAEHASSATATELALGTPMYMAPEQILNLKVSPLTDIHAFGMNAYTLLVGDA